MAKDSPFDRALPSNIEAERSILGAILLDNQTINQAAEMLRRDDFFLDSHRRIYDKMLHLMEQGRAIDPITLQDALKQAGDLELIGGAAFVGALIDGVPRFSNILEYCQIVKGKSIVRKLITTSNQIMNRCFDAEDTPDVLLDEAERAILSIAEDRIRQGFVPISEVAHKQLQHIEEIASREQLVTGISTGFRDLDYMTSGLQRGDLIIIAARPSMGKCLAADAEIVLEDGSLVTIEEVYHHQSARLLTLNDNWKLSFTEPSAFVDDGIKPVFRVTTKLGRTVESTITHPFLTFDGWRKLGELNVGDKIAVPREINVFGTEQISDGKVKLLAYLIGDGCLTKQTPEFTNTNPAIQVDYATAVAEFPFLRSRQKAAPLRAPSFSAALDRESIVAQRQAFAQKLRENIRVQPRGTSRRLALRLGVSPSLICAWLKGDCLPDATSLEKLCDALTIQPDKLDCETVELIRQNRNPLKIWLEELGLWGKNAHHKTIPSVVFKLPKSKLALFLNRLFATAGWVAITGDQLAQVGYATVSETLARQLQHLLLRFGIIAKLRKKLVKYKDSRRVSWQLDITHADSRRRFANEIGIFTKDDKLTRALQILDKEVNRTNRDLIPMPIWERLADLKGNESWASLARRADIKGYTNIHVGQREIPRQKLLTFADVLDDQSLREIANSDVYWDEIVSIEFVGAKQVYDLTIPHTHNFVANDICVHNTAFCLNIAQNAAMKQQHHGNKAIVGIFSLEMSKEQLVQRMLCAQSRIDAHRLRTGMLSKEDWRHLAMGVSELAEAQIFLDDTPAISSLEMRAKIRRLKNEQRGLDMIIVDYLQLMSGKGRTESRQQEVSQISRDLKAIAKEMNIPVIALSQLSRAVESRSDHRPMLSDLRESGCLAGESLVTLADTGERVPIKDLVGKAGFAVWALNEETMQVERALVSNAFATGVKPVFKLTTKLGRTIRATANHKFRTFLGWQRLDELQIGARLALPRQISSPITQTMTSAELALLGHLMGDGCTLPRHAIQYTTKENDLAETVANLAVDVFGAEITPRVKQERSWYQVYLSSNRHHTHNVRSAVTEWLMDLGVWGLRSHEKRVPQKVFMQPANAIATFLRHLWATDGCIWVDEKKRKHHPGIYYATSSELLARDVQALLLRIGINASLRRVSQGSKGRDQFHVIISGKKDITIFAELVSAVGQRKLEALAKVQSFINSTIANANRDIIPADAWRKYVVPAMNRNSVTTRQMMMRIDTAYCGTTLYQQNMSRERALRVASAVHSEELLRLAQSGIYWDQVVSVEPDDEAEVFDLTVPNLQNFESEGLIAHNSIEQDADIVMFIYRDEVYNPETEKPNVAEIIIGKQRNGPIGDIELVFLKQLTRFEDKYRE